MNIEPYQACSDTVMFAPPMAISRQGKNTAFHLRLCLT